MSVVNASIAAVERRRGLLEKDLHTAEGAEQLKVYIRKVKQLYSLAKRYDEAYQVMAASMADILEIMKTVAIPSIYQDCESYQKQYEWPLPVIPRTLLFDGLGSIAEVKIVLPEKASKVNE